MPDQLTPAQKRAIREAREAMQHGQFKPWHHPDFMYPLALARYAKLVLYGFPFGCIWKLTPAGWAVEVGDE